MTYAYPTNVTGFFSGFQYANSVTDGWFSATIIFIVFAITFLIVKFTGFKAQAAFASASFIATIMAIGFLVLGLVSPLVLVACVAALVGSIVWLWFGDKVEY